MRQLIFALAMVLSAATTALAQQLTVATVTRPPFSMVEDGQDVGFSIDLWRAVADDLGRDFSLLRANSFGEMLKLVENSQVDLAVANISITAERERVMDFSQPIFESGLRVMVPHETGSDLSVLKAVFSRELLTAVALAIGLLFLAGMVMWRLERKAQPYFDMTGGKAMFPAFWWALNLVVNGGFEERAPRTPLGRIFGVLLVISSLFIVSIFVANVTAVLTVDAISNNVNSINDLYGKRVGTIEGSTASAFMENRDLRHQRFANLDDLLTDFENGKLDAVVFDAPILAFYAKESNGNADLAGPIFRRENYGIALPSESILAEPINQSLLRLRENGTYTDIYRKWFGTGTEF